MDWLTIFAQVAALLALLYFYIKHKLSFWSKRGVPHPKPNILTLGINFKRFTQGPEIYTKEQLEDHGKVFGAYMLMTPILIVNDADLIKQIMIKDFHLFMDKPDQGTFDPMWNLNLFMASGEPWKRIRTITSPTFTSGKLRAMHLKMNRCVKMLTNHLEQIASPSAVVNVKEIITGFTIDVIATTSFATETNVNDNRSKTNPFVEHGIKLFHFKPLKIFSVFLLPLWWNNLIGIRSQFTPEHFDFFGNLVKEIVKQRKTNQGRGNDFVQLLMDAYATDKELKETNFDKLTADMDKDESTSTETKKHSGSSKNTLSDSEIAAQCLIFFVAGFETTSSTITHMLYELAQNQDIQERVRDELSQTLGDLDVDSEEFYDTALNRLPYLDAVTKETLRKYPPLIRVERRLTVDGYKLGGISLEKNMKVVVSTYGVHHNPEYYPDPERFDPERFMPENKHNLVPYTYLPFGIGPRNCIGMRFAYQEIKILLSQLLQQFKFSPTESTPKCLHFKGSSLILTPFPFDLKIERL